MFFQACFGINGCLSFLPSCLEALEDAKDLSSVGNAAKAMKAICKLFGKVLEKPHLHGKTKTTQKLKEKTCLC